HNRAEARAARTDDSAGAAAPGPGPAVLSKSRREAPPGQQSMSLAIERDATPVCARAPRRRADDDAERSGAVGHLPVAGENGADEPGRRG
ncbi:MAG TPA: hypothetical protein VMC78_23245, partial [Mycobacterium sp.]|nr:hypothetical protein [Mycobacterium sp.]